MPRSPRSPLPRGFGALWSTVAIDLIGFGIVIPILPLYAERFGASPFQVGILGAAYSLAQLVFSPLWGRVSDRIGRRPVLLASLLGTMIASVICGLAGSLWVLILARALDGASGATVGVAQASVADIAPPRERSRLLGLIGAAFGLGFVIGPALGGVASVVARRLRPDDLSAPGRAAFLLTAALAAANTVAALFRLPETKPAAPSGNPGHADAGSEGTGGRGGPGGRGGRWRDHVGPLTLVAFGSVAAFSAFEYTFSLFGDRRLGFDEKQMSVVFVVVGVLISLVQGGLIGRVTDRVGPERALGIGLGCTALGLVLLPAVYRWWILGVPLLFLCVGQGVTSPSLSAAAIGRAAPERRGAMLGVQQSAGALGRVVGPLAGGALFQSVGIGTPYFVGAVVFAACAVLTARTIVSGEGRRTSVSMNA